MGNAMHSLKTLLQLPCGWRCSRQIISADGIALYLRGKRKTAQCPQCLKRSDSVHSCRRRRIQHLPCLFTKNFCRVACPLRRFTPAVFTVVTKFTTSTEINSRRRGRETGSNGSGSPLQCRYSSSQGYQYPGDETVRLAPCRY